MNYETDILNGKTREFTATHVRCMSWPRSSNSHGLISNQLFSVLLLSAHHSAPAVLAMQPTKFGSLSFHLSALVSVLIPSVVTSRPTTASRPSNPLNLSLHAPQIRPLLNMLRVYKLYLLSYLLACNRKDGNASIVAASFALIKRQGDTTFPVTRGLTIFQDLVDDAV